MSFANPSDEVIRDLLRRSLNVAVVGCSPDPTRDSHRIAELLIARGHHVFPVNPLAHEILGRRCYASLRDVSERIDMVDIFRRPEHVAAVVDEAITCGVSVVWMQLGVVDETAAARAQRAGITVIMDRCPAIEYRRLFGAS
jgi:predicted CoA-binding protein